MEHSHTATGTTWHAVRRVCGGERQAERGTRTHVRTYARRHSTRCSVPVYSLILSWMHSLREIQLQGWETASSVFINKFRILTNTLVMKSKKDEKSRIMTSDGLFKMCQGKPWSPKWCHREPGPPFCKKNAFLEHPGFPAHVPWLSDTNGPVEGSSMCSSMCSGMCSPPEGRAFSSELAFLQWDFLVKGSFLVLRASLIS